MWERTGNGNDQLTARIQRPDSEQQLYRQILLPGFNFDNFAYTIHRAPAIQNGEARNVELPDLYSTIVGRLPAIRRRA
ncbi:hypothetical protein Tcan_08148 [Toxocara canis]|uniref:Uncharacterized protein n=1 Tax=Toxocara canis TaxID=6265 RepID=A0A0B2VX88_TOXCA|nr:hypothetical protein Tcan_08148 [Toxocara canis]